VLEENLFTPTFNQISRCEIAARNPGTLPPELSAIHVKGHFDAAAFKLALDQVASKQEALRSNFPIIDGKRWLRVLAAPRFEMRFHDLSATP
jgi:hypothetical protein